MWSRFLVYGLFGALSLVTAVRNEVWLTDRALWTDAALKAPHKPRPQLNLGRQLDNANDNEAAIRYYRTAITLSFDPRRMPIEHNETWAAAETNIAHVLLKQGQVATAMRMLDGVIAKWPNYAYAHFNRGVVLRDHKLCENATHEFAMALRADAALKVPVPVCLP